MPSKFQVCTMRSGRTTSRNSPWKPYLVPSVSMWVKCHRPPGRTSICSMVILYFRGPIHWVRSRGSVYARNTMSRGALKVRSIRISVSLGVVITVGFAVDCEAFIDSCITIWLYNHSVKVRPCKENTSRERGSYTKTRLVSTDTMRLRNVQEYQNSLQLRPAGHRRRDSRCFIAVC